MIFLCFLIEMVFKVRHPANLIYESTPNARLYIAVLDMENKNLRFISFIIFQMIFEIFN